jgi:uncharacterized membrane protein
MSMTQISKIASGKIQVADGEAARALDLAGYPVEFFKQEGGSKLYFVPLQFLDAVQATVQRIRREKAQGKR